MLKGPLGQWYNEIIAVFSVIFVLISFGCKSLCIFSSIKVSLRGKRYHNIDIINRGGGRYEKLVVLLHLTSQRVKKLVVRLKVNLY